jgi:hypothetical protein
MAPTQDRDAELRAALTQMEQTANNVALRIASAASVRQRYLREIKEMSDSIWQAYKAGELSPAAGAQIANGMRNEILNMSRAYDMDWGRAYAQKLKKTGLSLDQVVHYIMNNKEGFKERFAGKTFSSLSDADKGLIYEEVIRSAGRDRGRVTAAIPRLRWASRGLWIATAAIAVYNVGTSNTPWWQTGREGANIGGGLLGSMAGGAAMGAAGGVWAGPIGVGVGVIVGGILGSSLCRGHRHGKPAHAVLRRPFSGFFTGTDETGMAQALAREHSANPAFVLEVFRALDADYTTDSDDVAYEYVSIARRSPALARMIKGHPALRAYLAELLEGGYSARSERQAAQWLRAP